MTVVGWVRHGVTDWNEQGRMQGRNDIMLNEAGRKQAHLLGKRMQNEHWDYIYSSDMKRASETADIIAGYMGMKVEAYDPLLAERSFGDVEGTTEQERLERWGEAWRTMDHGGEPREEVEKRWRAILERLHIKHTGKRVLVVSHGAVIGSMLETMFPEFGFIGLKNTCVNILTKTDGGWKCQLHNCVKHLEEA